MNPKTDDFRKGLMDIFNSAESLGLLAIEVNSGKGASVVVRYALFRHA